MLRRLLQNIKAIWNLILLPMYWIIVIWIIFSKALLGTEIDNRTNYAYIWENYVLLSTIIYGYLFYLPKMIQYLNKPKYLGIMVPFVLITSFCVASVFNIITINNKIASLCVSSYAGIIIILTYAATDFFLGRVRINNVNVFAEEGKYFFYVDMPCLVGFVVITAFREVSVFNTIRYFVAGANAFQLVAFNSAFTIILVYLEITRIRGGTSSEPVSS